MHLPGSIIIKPNFSFKAKKEKKNKRKNLERSQEGGQNYGLKIFRHGNCRHTKHTHTAVFLQCREFGQVKIKRTRKNTHKRKIKVDKCANPNFVLHLISGGKGEKKT